MAATAIMLMPATNEVTKVFSFMENPPGRQKQNDTGGLQIEARYFQRTML
jgi:hypothetical protein